MLMTLPVVGSIGTTHPWNIAGIGLDALVAAEYGLAHLAAVAGVTAQDAGGVRAVHAIPAPVLQAQLDAFPLLGAVAVGALISTANVGVTVQYLRTRAERIPVVVDPVMTASLGGELSVDDGVLQALRDDLLALPVIVTPNLHEAAQLTGKAVESLEHMERAAQTLVERGARAALVKGGHRSGEPVDVLATAQDVWRLGGDRIAGDMRGTGCTLAAALACELARGAGLRAAAQGARRYVRNKIAAGRMREGLQVAF